MGEKLQILLNSEKNVDSVNVDTYQKFEVSNKTLPILEYNVRNAMSATEIFDAEREYNETYRIYGRIEHLSLLNGLSNNYSELSNFFLPEKSNSKNIYNSFDFYLVRPKIYTKIIGTPSTGTMPLPQAPIGSYKRYFEVIATPDDLDLFDAGFTTNVYGDQVYTYDYKKDFDVSQYIDNFKFPATELFLYAKYKTTVNGVGEPEELYGTTWANIGGSGTTVLLNSNPLEVGDTLFGDIINYSKPEFLIEEIIPQTYFINTPYLDDDLIQQRLQWEYNPFIPLRLRYFSDELNNVNTGSTSYSQQISIPYYATNYPTGTDNYIWRDILPQGFIDPTTGLGVNYPFVNKKRYLFSKNILDVKPNLDDSHTYTVFNEIEFGAPSKIAIRPNSNIGNIGKPC